MTKHNIWFVVMLPKEQNTSVTCSIALLQNDISKNAKII
jgi:hypothetical protein